MYSTPQGVWHTMDVSYDFTWQNRRYSLVYLFVYKNDDSNEMWENCCFVIRTAQEINLFFTEKEVVCKYIHCFKRTFKLRLKTVAFPARPRPFL